MYAVYAFGILVLFALLGARFIYQKKIALSFLNFLFFSGLIYLFLGLYLGEYGLNVLSSDVLVGFSPIINLGLGWIGFIFGFQLEYKYLKRFPGKYISLSMLQFLFIFLFVFVCMVFLLQRIYVNQPKYLHHGMATAFGLLVSLHSPTILNAVAPLLPKRGDYFYLARFLVSIGAFWGIAGLALLYSFWHYPFFNSGTILKGILLLAVSTVIPALLGYLFHRLTDKKIDPSDLLVYLLGFIFFVSGAAFYFNLLPLYVCMVMGITFSNLTRRHENIYPLLISSEKPLYVILWILIGALWNFSFNPEIVFLIFVLIVLRAGGYMLPLPFFSKILRFPQRLPYLFGLSFMSAGGIGIAFSISIKLAYPIPLTDTFLSVSLLMILLSEFLSLGAFKISLFKLDKGE